MFEKNFYLTLFLFFLFSIQIIFAETNDDSSKNDAFSKISNIENVDRFVKLKFTVNVTKIVNYNPFLATCKVKKSNSTAGQIIKNQDYVVSFYRTNGHQKQVIARYEVFAPTSQYPKGRHLVSTERKSDLDVEIGRHYNWPTFDLVIQPKNTPAQNYWCELTTGQWMNESLINSTFENKSVFSETLNKLVLNNIKNDKNNEQSKKCWNCTTTESYPTDFTTEKNDNDSNQQDKPIKLVSNIFVQTPVLTLSTNDTGYNRYLVNCALQHFTAVENIYSTSLTPFYYSVSFYFSSDYLMGTFRVKETTDSLFSSTKNNEELSVGNQRSFFTTFISESYNYYRQVVGYGPNFNYPFFQVELETDEYYYRGEHFCKLVFTDYYPNVGGSNETGSPYTREIVSNSLYK